MVRHDFVNQMQWELDQNSHKGDWAEWKPSKLEAISDLQYHLAKLTNALTYKNESHRVAEYCADCANILMKIDELYKL
jgi:hypothetical protein